MPALTQADLGIAVSRASDVAREAADIILLKSEIEAVPEALGLARAATRKPVLLAAAAAALLVLKPARALRYITRGAMAVSLLRRLLGWMDREPR